MLYKVKTYIKYQKLFIKGGDEFVLYPSICVVLDIKDRQIIHRQRQKISDALAPLKNLVGVEEELKAWGNR